METYYVRCKKNTGNKILESNSSILVRKNLLYQKSNIFSRLLTKLAIRISLSNVPVIGDILY